MEKYLNWLQSNLLQMKMTVLVKLKPEHFKSTKMTSVLPLILTALLHADLINVGYLYQVMVTLHFLNDVANNAEPPQKSIITSKSLVWNVKQWVNW